MSIDSSPSAPSTPRLPGPRPGEYERWIAEYDTLSDHDCEAIAAAIAALKQPPLVSVVMVSWQQSTLDDESRVRSINSLLGQLYPRWELLDPSLPPRSTLDARLRPMGAISLDAVVAQARGELLAFVEAGDALAPQALFAMVQEYQTKPLPDILYSDEDEIAANGCRQRPYFKCRWNPDLFYSQDYACRLVLVPIELARRLARGAPRPAAVYDLLLQIVEDRADAVVRHVPLVLYHRQANRQHDEVASEEMRRPMEDHLRSCANRAGTVPPQVFGLPGAHRRVVWPIPQPSPKVSIIIPTRDQAQLLKTCVEGIRNDTDYPELEIIIIDNGSREAATHNYLKNLSGDRRIRVLSYPGEFNYSAINNFGIDHASGDVIGLLNNDLEIFEPGWLREMVSQAVRPDVGAVGAMLYYGDGTVQHAGVVLGIGGVASHIFKRQPATGTGYNWRMALAQDYSAVTAACLLTRSDVWKSVGGLDESFRVAYNDIDLCLRIVKAGYRVIWTPFARLRHLESASRGGEDDPEKRARFEAEKARMKERWGDMLTNDPFFSPNLSLTSVDCRPAFPPRILPPWRTSPTSWNSLKSPS